jgi:hypothetical protein
VRALYSLNGLRRTILVRGMIHHMRGNESVNAKANAIFETYQRQAADGTLPFRRWPLKRVRLFCLKYIPLQADSRFSIRVIILYISANRLLISRFSARGKLLSSYFSHNGMSPFESKRCSLLSNIPSWRNVPGPLSPM